MSTLFEISAKFKHLLDLVETDVDSDESLQDAIVNTLESVEYEFNDKVVDCVKYIKNLQAQSDAIKQASDAMLKRRTAMEKRIENVKQYVLDNMQATQIEKVECEYFKVSLKNNPPSVKVMDDTLIPAEFMRTKTVIEIDKQAIKQAGGCEGAIIVQNKSLSIK